MNPREWQQVQELFAQVCDLSPDCRDRAIQERCPDNSQVRQEVEALLFHHDHSDEFLEESAVDQVVQIIEKKSEEMEERFPIIDGPYEVVSLLGKGGMGSVYVARQLAPVERTVALKVINFGMEQTDFSTRFRYEHQALAMMNHSHIAHVYEAGTTTDGRPFFTMEYVSGMAVTEFCDQNQLDLEQRLELFLQICDGVQHAHRKGIIHRDLKPSNILIALEDGKPVPKIIDFGIAKVIDQGSSLSDKKTLFGTLMGTPAYMSPEQAEGKDMDTGADVYALGMLLYELIVGALPYEPDVYEITSPTAVLRLVLEKDPPLPSVRMAQRSQTNGHSLRADLVKKLKTDLDWVVMKAIEKDRARRFDSVAHLGADIKRFLNQQPVEACPPDRVYLMKKFIRRHKTAVGTVALFVLAGFIAIASLGSGLYVANKARASAAMEAQKATTIQVMLQDILLNVDPKAPDQKAEIGRLLDATGDKIDEFEGQPETVAELRTILARVYSNWGDYKKAFPQVEKALALREQIHPPGHPDRLLARQYMATIHRRLGNYHEAEHLYRGTLAARQQYLGEFHTETLKTLQGLAETLRRLGNYEQASELYTDVLARQRELLGEEDQITLITLNNYCNFLMEIGQYREAEDYFRESWRLRAQALPLNHPDTLSSMHGLVWSLYEQGRYEEAEPLARQTLELRRLKLRELGPEVMKSGHMLGLILMELGKYRESERLFLTALENLRESLSPHHLDTLDAMNNLAHFYNQVDRYGEALDLKLAEMRIRNTQYGPNHLRTLLSSLTLGQTYLHLEDWEKAEEVFCHAVTQYGEQLQPDNPNLALAMGFLGTCWNRMGTYQAATGLLAESVFQLRRAHSSYAAVMEEEFFRNQRALAEKAREGADMLH